MDPISDGFKENYDEDIESQSMPLFRLENTYVDERILQHGSIMCLSVSNQTVCFGTSKACLVRYNLDRDEDSSADDSFLVMDLYVKRWGDQTPHNVFMDITSKHTIVTIKNSAGNSETYYHYHTWENAQPITRLKNIIVNAVAFQKTYSDEPSTREILVGTTTGQLYETLIEEREKKEKYLKLLYDFGENQEPICDIQHEKVNNKIVVMVTTFSRLYLFSGFGSFESLFSLYKNRTPRITEIPNTLSLSKLSYFPHKRGFDNFSWLCGTGIYYGLINFNTHSKSVAGSNDDFEAFIENKHLLEYAKFNDGEVNFPVNFCVSEYHFLIIYKNNIKIISRINMSIVEEIKFQTETETENFEFNKPNTSQTNSSGFVGSCVDLHTNSIFIYTADNMYMLLPLDESRDLWKIYLNLKDYASALENCRNEYSRDYVYYTQAENAFSENLFQHAAQFYAKVVALKTFEEISLKFISANQQDALRTYLSYKLDYLPDDKISQSMMIATWLVELYLDKINKILLNMEYGKFDTTNKNILSNNQNENKNDENNIKNVNENVKNDNKSDTINENNKNNNTNNNNININDNNNNVNEYNYMKEEFHAFLTDNQNLLDELTTIKLLSSYGREEELLLFSKLKNLHENVIQHYIRKGDAAKALSIFKEKNVSIDLQYKFGPFLMKLDAKSTVDNWINFSSQLNPSFLLPSLLRFANNSNLQEGTFHAIRYLEHCIYEYKTEDKSIHNLLLSLYTKQEDESKLIKFLNFGKKDENDNLIIFYDPKYALKLCLKEKKMVSCIQIYSIMKMRHEAVALALQIDINIAKEEANKVDDLELRRKLWLMIARFVIEENDKNGRNGRNGKNGKKDDQDKTAKTTSDQEEKEKMDNNDKNGNKDKIVSDNIRSSILLLKETNGLLKLEDILPFFPDFVLIDDFKDAICDSLNDYNREIESLKMDMDESSMGAERIRNDIKYLNKRFLIIKKTETCELCKKVILSMKSSKQEESGNHGFSPFYIFPCSHSFHSSCLLSYVLEYSKNEKKIKIQNLKTQLQIILKKMNSFSKSNNQNQSFGQSQSQNQINIEKIRAEFDECIASECVFCGELMISFINLPFIEKDEDEEEMKTWSVGTN